ncbi:hypothetical protein PG994_007294 [Apiospora phragmitis]|uniref:DUF7708 domain-containing protein n=1 Tax=Apiospora phragmitis TaxID=2905665 RepID=A0ABR1V2V8_9PEZI
MQSLEKWFSDDVVDEYTVAQEVYQEGFIIFASELTSDPSKVHEAQNSPTLPAVRKAVLQAQSTYLANKKNQKIKDRLGKLASLLSHYGNIIEVFAQHHPEYVALAWGAIKMLLVFLIRARNWFQEGWLKHVWHSVSRPVSLQYGDLLEEIKLRSDLVDKLALSGSQAEQRVMHLKMDSRNSTLVDMHAELQQMREMIISLRSVTQGGFLETNLRLEDLQLTNLLESLTNPRLLNPNVIYQQKLIQKTQTLRQRPSDMDLSWTTRMLTQWSSSPQSSILLLKNTWDRRFQVQNLLVSIVELLKALGVPAVWVLEPAKGFFGGAGSRSLSTEEVVRSLIAQALQLPNLQVKQALGARICAQLRGHNSEDDLLTLFGSIISQVPAVYVIIDAGVLGDQKIPVTWPRIFNRIFQDMSARGWH